jgi:ABC-type multidrug transport system fused ATPase/permease subunit
MFLLSFPVWVCMVLVLAIVTLFSVGIYYVIHLIWAGDISEGTIRTASMVAIRSGVVYAFVIGMMFTGVFNEYNEMVMELEMEASALTRLHEALERHRDHEKFKDTREQLVKYIRFVVDEQWPALRELRGVPADLQITRGRALEQVWRDLDKIEYKPGDLNLKALLDSAEDHSIQRLFDIKGEVLPVFWYIAIIGYFFTLIPLCLEPPTFRRCLLVALYSNMIAMVLLGTFILTHPYSPAAGINPQVFQWLMEI